MRGGTQRWSVFMDGRKYFYGYLCDIYAYNLAGKYTCNYFDTISRIKTSCFKNEFLVVFGASGNTGMMAIQLGKKMGAKVIAVSKDNWIKDFGVDYSITQHDRVAEIVNELSQGKMADVVLNSLGIQTWENSFASVG